MAIWIIEFFIIVLGVTALADNHHGLFQSSFWKGLMVCHLAKFFFVLLLFLICWMSSMAKYWLSQLSLVNNTFSTVKRGWKQVLSCRFCLCPDLNQRPLNFGLARHWPAPKKVEYIILACLIDQHRLLDVHSNLLLLQMWVSCWWINHSSLMLLSMPVQGSHPSLGLRKGPW